MIIQAADALGVVAQKLKPGMFRSVPSEARVVDGAWSLRDAIKELSGSKPVYEQFSEMRAGLSHALDGLLANPRDPAAIGAARAEAQKGISNLELNGIRRTTLADVDGDIGEYSYSKVVEEAIDGGKRIIERWE